MPRSGAGVYSKPAGTTAVSGTTISSSDYNSTIDDLVTDANTARPVVAGGTGSTTASGARTALGVAIGSNVQAYDAGLASIAGLTTAADKMVYTTASDTYATTDLSSFARTLLDDANAAAVLTTLGAYSSSETDTAISAAVDAAPSAPIFVLEDQRSLGTAGGAASASWSQRPLQSIRRNVDSAVSLTSNQFTPAEDCWCEFEVAFYRSNAQARIYDVTDTASVGVSFVHSITVNSSQSVVTGAAYLTGGNTYELQDIMGSPTDTFDRGIPGSLATEIYARVTAWAV